MLELDEYRESLDIDFLCADKKGYRALRSTISHNSLGAICPGNLQLLREVRADMYGIRTFFEVDDQPVKFEIIIEGRIPLAGESIQDIPFESLSHVSCFAEKFLAYGAAVHTELLFALDEMEKSKFRKSCIRNLAVSNPRKLDRGLKILGNL